MTINSYKIFFLCSVISYCPPIKYFSRPIFASIHLRLWGGKLRGSICWLAFTNSTDPIHVLMAEWNQPIVISGRLSLLLSLLLLPPSTTSYRPCGVLPYSTRPFCTASFMGSIFIFIAKLLAKFVTQFFTYIARRIASSFYTLGLPPSWLCAAPFSGLGSCFACYFEKILKSFLMIT